VAAVITVVSEANPAESITHSKSLAESFAADMALTNDYVFRGISQSDAKPAIQASIGYSRDMGPVAVSLGAWGCNVEFNDGDKASVELDYTLDFCGTVGGEDGLGLSVGGIYYTYPGAANSLNFDFSRRMLARHMM